jgi:hypothetical protein
MFVAICLASISCNDDEETQTPTVKFSASTSNASEGDGTIEIELSATQAVSSDIEVSFELSGSAYLNGDYMLETASPITLKAGSKTATIVLDLIDESIIESTDDKIKINLTSIGSNAVLSETSGDLEHIITISDNDNLEANELQVDLTWDLGEGEDIDRVNFDLYLATNVVIEDNTVTGADIYKGSENSLGFETLRITQDDEDAEYYIVVSYIKGNVNADFTINLNGGDGYSDESFTNTFAAANVGSAVFYGPLTKSGSSIGRRKGFQKIMSSAALTK